MKQKKKVLFTATVDSHIMYFHLPFLKLFKDKGYEVHVATNGKEEIPYCEVKHTVSFERSPMKINNLKAIRELKKIIDKEKFDIIHCHTPMGSVVTRLAAKNARKKYGTRVIYTAHGFHFFKGAPLKNWLLFYPVEKYLAKYTDTLITINKEDYNLANKKFSKRCHDIEYVPGVGIDVNRFSINPSEKAKNDLRKQLNIKSDDFILTCVARLDYNKNQIFLIKVIEQLEKNYNGVKLLLVGPDEINGFYQKYVKEKGIKNVEFLGRREDVPILLSITDVVVSASLREGLPVNIIEAFASSKPVVALNCRGMIDLVKDENHGFVIDDFKDIQMFANAVVKIMSDEKLRKNISSNNKNECKKYDIPSILEYMRNIYFK